MTRYGWDQNNGAEMNTRMDMEYSCHDMMDGLGVTTQSDSARHTSDSQIDVWAMLGVRRNRNAAATSLDIATMTQNNNEICIKVADFLVWA